MPKALLLNMAAYTIVKEFDSVEAAEEARDLPEFEGYPKHVVERDNWDLTAVDFVKFYNALPTTKTPVKRFSDRATGMKRLLAALNGETTPDEPIDTQETAPVKKPTKTAKKKTTKKPAAKRPSTGRAPRHELTAVLKPTKTGQDRRWQKERKRSQLFEHIVKKGEVTIEQLIAHGEKALGMKVGEVRAALQKMLSDECVKAS